MIKSRFTGSFGRWRKRRLWRTRKIRQVAEKRVCSLRRCMLLVLAAEVGVGGWQILETGEHEIQMIRVEEEYRIEWYGEGPVYGVRLNPEKLELEFYHREAVKSGTKR